MKTCCEIFKERQEDLKLDKDTGKYYVLSCCNDCYALNDIKHCPWCGSCLIRA